MINSYIEGFFSVFTTQRDSLPWLIPLSLSAILEEMIIKLDNSYTVKDGIAVHHTATVEIGVVLKAPVIVSEGCFIGANAYLRGGVYLGNGSTVGTSCEVKASIIMQNSSVAHFNFIGDSIIGSNVNLEAGSIVANHFNERSDKQIRVMLNGKAIDTGVKKFGALVDDNFKIGANAVLSPGTILAKNTVVKHMELVEQFIVTK